MHWLGEEPGLDSERRSCDFSSSNQATIDAEQRYTSGAYPKRPVAITHGSGAWVWDADGHAYIDMAGGHGVALLGHAHPAIAEAVASQSRRLITCPEIFYNDRRAELYARLRAQTPGDIGRFFLCNSGAEAVEGALKLARLLTGRSRVVATRNGFHGRTMGALSATWNPKYRQVYEPLVPGFVHIPYNDLAAADEAIHEQTAAVILEAVQGEGGVHPAQTEFLHGLQRICRERGALLILDEIQTGLGRTGRWFACQHHDLVPDVLCLGKGLAGGLPMGAVAWRCALGGFPKGSHGSTFGGNPLVCAASIANLNVLEREQLPERAAQVGGRFLQALQAMQHPLVREVRGMGLMIGMELRRRVTPLLKILMRNGILALPAGPTVLRLLPPLIIEEADLEMAVRVIQSALEELNDA